MVTGAMQRALVLAGMGISDVDVTVCYHEHSSFISASARLCRNKLV